MNRKRYQSAMAELFYRRNLWMVVALVMSVANLLEAYWLVGRERFEQHHLIPPGAREFSFSGQRYTTIYWEDLATWFVGLALTYTPETFDHQAALLLRYVHPDGYGVIKARLLEEKQLVDKKGQSQVFFPRGTVKVRGREAVIEGILSTRMGAREVDKRNVAYLLEFRPLPGGPIGLVKFEEVTNERDPFGRHDS